MADAAPASKKAIGPGKRYYSSAHTTQRHYQTWGITPLSLTRLAALFHFPSIVFPLLVIDDWFVCQALDGH